MAFDKRPVGTCSACGGRIVEISEKPDDPAKVESPPAVVGAGESRRLYPVVGIHCDDCGIKYAFVPLPRVKVSRPALKKK